MQPWSIPSRLTGNLKRSTIFDLIVVCCPISNIFNCCIQGLPRFDRPSGEQGTKPVVDRLLKVLFAAKISLRGEDGRVSQEELNLFDFAARRMAQICTGPTQIMWSEVVQLRPFSTPANHVPDDILGDAFFPTAFHVG